MTAGPAESVVDRGAEQRQEAEERRRALHASLDLFQYATDTAGEAWALMTQMLLVEGKPRFPTIAAELELSPPQAIVMRLLAEPRAMSDLANAMACDNSNITGIVDRLEERGLVERTPAAYDRRVKLIAATNAGDKVRKELNRRLAIPPEPLANLSEADKRALRDILRKAFAE
jgi:DNA-binding MarR family transcriptional regulator